MYEAIPSVQDSQTEALIAETNVISNDFQTKTGNLCYLNKWLESLNICENIKAGFVSLLCRKCGVSLSFFAQSIQMQAIELTEDQWNDIAFYLKPNFFDLALPADKYQEIQRIYDSLGTLAAVEPQNIEEYYQSKKEIQISKIRETCTRCTIKPLKICDDYQNNDLIAYSVDKSFFIFSDKIEIRKKTKTKTISLSELCQLKDLADIPGEYHSPIIDIIGAFNPDNATELLKKNQNQCSVGCGCCLCILLVVLFWILKLPWWTWIIGLIVAMLVPQLFTFPKTKEKIQSFKNKQSIDYISYDKGWLDFEKGIVRTEKDITNVR